MAASTRARVSGRTGPVPLMTRETVMCDTPATPATSVRLGCRVPAAFTLTGPPERGRSATGVPFRPLRRGRRHPSGWRRGVSVSDNTSGVKTGVRNGLVTCAGGPGVRGFAARPAGRVVGNSPGAGDGGVQGACSAPDPDAVNDSFLASGARNESFTAPPRCQSARVAATGRWSLPVAGNVHDATGRTPV